MPSAADARVSEPPKKVPKASMGGEYGGDEEDMSFVSHRDRELQKESARELREIDRRLVGRIMKERYDRDAITRERIKREAQERTHYTTKSVLIGDFIVPKDKRYNMPMGASDELNAEIERRTGEVQGRATRMITTTVSATPGVGKSESDVIGEADAYKSNSMACLAWSLRVLKFRQCATGVFGDKEHGLGVEDEDIVDQDGSDHIHPTYWKAKVRPQDVADVTDFNHGDRADSAVTAVPLNLVHDPSDPDYATLANFVTEFVSMEYIRECLLPAVGPFRSCVNGSQCKGIGIMRKASYFSEHSTGEVPTTEFLYPDVYARVRAKYERGESDYVAEYGNTPGSCYHCIVYATNRHYHVCVATSGDTPPARTYNAFAVHANVQGEFSNAAVITWAEGARVGIIGNFPRDDETNYVLDTETLPWLRREDADRFPVVNGTVQCLRLRKQCFFDYGGASLTTTGAPDAMYKRITVAPRYSVETAEERAMRFWGSSDKQGVFGNDVKIWATQPLGECAASLRHHAHMSRWRDDDAPTCTALKPPPFVTRFYADDGCYANINAPKTLTLIIAVNDHISVFPFDEKQSILHAAVVRTQIFEHAMREQVIPAEDMKLIHRMFRYNLNQLGWFVQRLLDNLPVDDGDVPARLLRPMDPITIPSGHLFTKTDHKQIVTADPSPIVQALVDGCKVFAPYAALGIPSSITTCEFDEAVAQTKRVVVAHPRTGSTGMGAPQALAAPVVDRAVVGKIMDAVDKGGHMQWLLPRLRKAALASTRAAPICVALAVRVDVLYSVATLPAASPPHRVHAMRLMDAHLPLLSAVGGNMDVTRITMDVISAMDVYPKCAPVTWIGSLPRVAGRIDMVGLLGDLDHYVNVWTVRTAQAAEQASKDMRKTRNTFNARKRRTLTAIAKETKAHAALLKKQAVDDKARCRKEKERDAGHESDEHPRRKGKRGRKQKGRRKKATKETLTASQLAMIDDMAAAHRAKLEEYHQDSLSIPSEMMYDSVHVDGTMGYHHHGMCGFSPSVARLQPHTTPNDGDNHYMTLATEQSAVTNKILRVFSALVPRRGCVYGPLFTLTTHTPADDPAMGPFFMQGIMLTLLGCFPWMTARAAPEQRVDAYRVFGHCAKRPLTQFYCINDALVVVCMRQALLFVINRNRSYRDALRSIMPAFDAFEKSTIEAGRAVATMYGKDMLSLDEINLRLTIMLAYRAPDGSERLGSHAIVPLPAVGYSRLEALHSILTKGRAKRVNTNLETDMTEYVTGPAWERAYQCIVTMLVPGFIPHPFVLGACTMEGDTPEVLAEAKEVYRSIARAMCSEIPIKDGVAILVHASYPAFRIVYGFLRGLLAHGSVTDTAIASVDHTANQLPAIRWRYNSQNTQYPSASDHPPTLALYRGKRDLRVGEDPRGAYDEDVAARPWPHHPRVTASAATMDRLYPEEVADVPSDTWVQGTVRPCCYVFGTFPAAIPSLPDNSSSFGNLRTIMDVKSGRPVCHSGGKWNKQKRAQHNATVFGPTQELNSERGQRKLIKEDGPTRDPDISCGDFEVVQYLAFAHIVHTWHRFRLFKGTRMGGISMVVAQCCGRQCRVDVATITRDAVYCNSCMVTYAKSQAPKTHGALCCICLKADEALTTRSTITYIDDTKAGDYLQHTGYTCWTCIKGLRKIINSLQASLGNGSTSRGVPLESITYSLADLREVMKHERVDAEMATIINCVKQCDLGNKMC